jgi:CheY-like chemotaxis protein
MTRVLVADDEYDAVLSLTLLLRAEGYIVRGAYRSSEVLQAITDFSPEVVLLDLGMPQITGYDVARALRERYGSARPILVAVTGHAKPSDRRLTQLAGFDGHVAKPYDPRQLILLLEELAAKPLRQLDEAADRKVDASRIGR